MQVSIPVLMGVVNLLERVWGSPIARDTLRFLQGKLGPKYNDEQLAQFDANYVEGLERAADAHERANRNASPDA